MIENNYDNIDKYTKEEKKVILRLRIRTIFRIFTKSIGGLFAKIVKN